MKQIGKYAGLIYNQCPKCKRWGRHFLIGYVGNRIVAKCDWCYKVYKTDKEEL